MDEDYLNELFGEYVVSPEDIVSSTEEILDQTDIDAQIRSEGCRALKCEGLTARLEDVRSKLSAAHSNRCVVLITALEGLLYTLGELFCARVNSGADRERYQTAIAGYKRLLVKAEELAAAGYEA